MNANDTLNSARSTGKDTYYDHLSGLMQERLAPYLDGVKINWNNRGLDGSSYTIPVPFVSRGPFGGSEDEFKGVARTAMKGYDPNFFVKFYDAYSKALGKYNPNAIPLDPNNRTWPEYFASEVEDKYAPSMSDINAAWARYEKDPFNVILEHDPDYAIDLAWEKYNQWREKEFEAYYKQNPGARGWLWNTPPKIGYLTKDQFKELVEKRFLDRNTGMWGTVTDNDKNVYRDEKRKTPYDYDYLLNCIISSPATAYRDETTDKKITPPSFSPLELYGMYQALHNEETVKEKERKENYDNWRAADKSGTIDWCPRYGVL